MRYLRTCINCAKECSIPYCRLSEFKYCSRKCLFDYKRRFMVEIECKICNSKFLVIQFRAKTARYCSDKCYFTSLKGKGHKEFSCPRCDKKYMAAPSKARKYCSLECKRRHPLEAGMHKGIGSIRTSMRRAGKMKSCNDCGYDAEPSILGIHHINEIHSDNRLENLVVLCPNCHSLRHRQHIPH